MKKIAVILFNLGGPDAKEFIEPFLFNFFMDKNIIRLPQPFRYFIARQISRRRSGNEAGKSYALLGNKSPLLENSRAQAAALEKTLNENAGMQFRTFVCMRYWHPMADEVAGHVKDWNPGKIILLPLYPQFSTTTTRSSFQAWDHAAKKHGLQIPAAAICCYPFNEGFIRASAENIRIVYERAKKDGFDTPRLLFSAHGLPENVIRDGDPYQWQCEEGAKKIVSELNVILSEAKDLSSFKGDPSVATLLQDDTSLDWSICYQSRVGRLKWIGPSAEEELRRAARDKKAVIIYPHAFTQEHVETLVEIEIEYRELAHGLGIPGFYRVPAVSTHPAFIESLAALARSQMDKKGVSAGAGRRLCPPGFCRCAMNAT